MYSIMLVEDEAIILGGLHKQIDWEKLGFNVCAKAINGIEAMSFIQSGMRVDAVLTDIRMPVMDGIELLRQIRELKLPTQVVLLSGYDEFDYAQKGIEYGAFDFILKPSSNKEICAVINRLKNKLDAYEEERETYGRLKTRAELADRLKNNQMFLSAYINAGDSSYSLEEKDSYLCVIGYRGSIDFNRSPGSIDREELILNAEDTGLIGSFITPDGRSYLLIVSPDSDSDEARERMYALCQNLKKRMESEQIGGLEDLILTGAVTDIEKGFKSLSELFKRVNELLKLRFFYDSQQIFTEQSLERHHNHKNIVPLDSKALSEVVIQAYRSKNINSVQSLLNHQLIKLKYSFKTADEIYVLLMEVWQFFLASLSSGEVETFVELNIDVYKELNRIIEEGSLLDAIEWFISLISMMVEVSVSVNASKSVEVIENVKQFIVNNLSCRITLPYVAKMVFMSPTYFSIIFKRYTGESFVKYLTESRIKKAKELLCMDYKIYEVADMVGYDDYRYFSKIFMRHTGINPNEYKKQRKHGERTSS